MAFYVFLVLLQLSSELWVNWDVAVYGVFLLQSFDSERVLDATVRGEYLILLQRENLRNAHSGVDAQGEDCFVAGGVEEFEDFCYCFGIKNGGLSGHVKCFLGRRKFKSSLIPSGFEVYFFLSRIFGTGGGDRLTKCRLSYGRRNKSFVYRALTHRK